MQPIFRIKNTDGFRRQSQDRFRININTNRGRKFTGLVVKCHFKKSLSQGSPWKYIKECTTRNKCDTSAVLSNVFVRRVGTRKIVYLSDQLFLRMHTRILIDTCNAITDYIQNH